jgi:hypothetical protein
MFKNNNLLSIFGARVSVIWGEAFYLWGEGFYLWGEGFGDLGRGFRWFGARVSVVWGEGFGGLRSVSIWIMNTIHRRINRVPPVEGRRVYNDSGGIWFGQNL